MAHVPQYFRQQQQQHQETPATPPAADPPAGTPPAADPPTPAEPQRNGKVLTMPSSAIAKMKRDEREKAERRMRAQLDADAKEAGYASYDDMKAKLAEQRKNKGRTPAASTPRPAARVTAPPAEPDDEPATSHPSERTQRRTSRELERMKERIRVANRARAQSERKARALQQERDANAAEHELRLVAVGVGVKDVDYAMTLLQRHLKGLSPEQVTSFDEEKYFKTELRKTHPYLYGVTTEPAHTSPAEGETREPSEGNKPTTPAKPAKDVRTMSPQEFQAHLRSKGITPPGLGLPGTN